MLLQITTFKVWHLKKSYPKIFDIKIFDTEIFDTKNLFQFEFVKMFR